MILIFFCNLLAGAVSVFHTSVLVWMTGAAEIIPFGLDQVSTCVRRLRVALTFSSLPVIIKHSLL